MILLPAQLIDQLGDLILQVGFKGFDGDSITPRSSPVGLHSLKCRAKAGAFQKLTIEIMVLLSSTLLSTPLFHG
jgi:hypothetical protein